MGRRHGDHGRGCRALPRGGAHACSLTCLGCSRLCRPPQLRASREGIERAEAIAAGVMENRRHERVNQILEEEINRLQSAAVKRTGRAYLSVIEGGTASFTPLRAEA